MPCLLSSLGSPRMPSRQDLRRLRDEKGLDGDFDAMVCFVLCFCVFCNELVYCDVQRGDAVGTDAKGNVYWSFSGEYSRFSPCWRALILCCVACDHAIDDGWLFRETPEYLAWNPKNARKRPSLRRKKGALPFLALAVCARFTATGLACSESGGQAERQGRGRCGHQWPRRRKQIGSCCRIESRAGCCCCCFCRLVSDCC